MLTGDSCRGRGYCSCRYGPFVEVPLVVVEVDTDPVVGKRGSWTGHQMDTVAAMVTAVVSEFAVVAGIVVAEELVAVSSTFVEEDVVIVAVAGVRVEVGENDIRPPRSDLYTGWKA